MKYCVVCKMAVKPYCGGFFKLNNDFYHDDCWPENEKRVDPDLHEHLMKESFDKYSDIWKQLAKR